MSLFSQILVALGVFFAAYAALTLLRHGGATPNRRARPLGCGFTLLAAVVWSFALGRYLGSTVAGVRLGTALALILPALATLAHTGRANVAGAAVLLTVAVLLGAPVLPQLRARLRPTPSAVTGRDLDRAGTELEQRIRATDEVLEKLDKDRRRLRREIGALGFADFESLAADRNGLLLLQELAALDKLREAAATRLEAMRRDVQRVETAARQIERLHDTEAATGVEVTRGELEDILSAADTPAAGATPETVEEHLERADLESLFEREFGSNTR